MFIGHFAAALASKKIDSSASLGITFLAAQWLDLLWPILLLTGVEKMEISKDPSSTIPLIFTHYPLSHSLLTVLFWSFLFGMIYFLLKRNGKGAMVIGFLVFSHWFLDFLVHLPDLPLTPFTETKVGLGGWHYKYFSLGIELMLFAGAIYLYHSTTASKNKTGKFALWSLVLFLITIQVMNTFGPPPASPQAVALVGLTQWLFVFWAWIIDKNRKSLEHAQV